MDLIISTVCLCKILLTKFDSFTCVGNKINNLSRINIILHFISEQYYYYIQIQHQSLTTQRNRLLSPATELAEVAGYRLRKHG